MTRRSIVWAAIAIVFVAVAAFWLTVDPRLDRLGSALSGDPGIPQAEFEKRVRAYLLEHPEVLVDAMEVLDARRQAAARSELTAVLAAKRDDLLHDPASPVGGAVEGDVTLVEFFDYNCPYCRRVAPVVDQAVAADAGLRVVYKEYPILGAGSTVAARAALAAQRQGRYIEYHGALMESRRAIDAETAMATAESLGLDLDRLKRDMDDPALHAAIERNIDLARVLRITGTPGFVVGDEIVRGATDLDTLQRLVRRARDATR